jgi:hydroxymethylglutaryl-CoA lyase
MARVAISMAFGCSFEGAVELPKLQSVIGAMVDGGFRRVVLCDTIGVAHPRQVYSWSQRCLASFPDVQFDLHLHDTYGRGLANILAALEAGVTTFDTAIGGLGGCPFAPGATGNVATEDVVALLESMGIQTGIDLDGLIDLSIRTVAQLGQPRRSHLSLARVHSPVAEGARCSHAPASWNEGVEIA